MNDNALELATDTYTNKGALHTVGVRGAQNKAFKSRKKRIFDVLFAGAGLVAILPILLAVAAMIKVTSPGPVLFRQKRYGHDKREFEVLKFRSMTVTEAGDAARQATRGDARVTKIGAFIRKTSIDELPQLWNVLRGDMSLVGPRPHPTALDQEFETQIPNYLRRFEAKPGITGLAQVRGQRGATETAGVMAARVDSDIEYIDTWSMQRDLKILASTIKVLFGDKHAY